VILLILPLMFRKEKPLKKPIFEKCIHYTRDIETRACYRCGIKVIWKGDEYRYNEDE
jgi:hypothetical protein